MRNPPLRRVVGFAFSREGISSNCLMPSSNRRRSLAARFISFRHRLNICVGSPIASPVIGIMGKRGGNLALLHITVSGGEILWPAMFMLTAPGNAHASVCGGHGQ